MLTRQTTDKDTIIFRAGQPVTRTCFSVSFNEDDKIRLIDAPNEQVRAAFMNACRVGCAAAPPRGLPPPPPLPS